MNKLKQIGIALISTSLLLPASSVLAATNGSKGSQSEGKSKIDASINKLIKIDKMSDIIFSSFSPGSAPSSKSMSFCVGMNAKKTTRNYTIKLTGNHTENSTFRLTLNGSSTTASNRAIKYQINLTDNASTPNTVNDLTPGTTINNNGNGFHTDSSLSCKNANQTLAVKMTSDTTDNLAGSYEDTLTLLVSPL